MGVVTVASWVLNALIGGYLLYLWLSGGGLRQQATKVTRFPVALIFSHPVLACSALACWVGYLVTGQRALAWLAFAVLSVAALLGFTMFTRWLGAGRHARGAEQRFPLLAVLAHGVVGVTTFVLVLLSASSIS
ncbi:hypothetical protein ACWENQ_12555 [Nonomuraea sp. NPDC004354]|uniref:hypothetical protein n=1 Tax=Nonomuraea sp. NPDC003804 TaxID=3154547 RepID=UPI0033A2614B